MGIELGIWSETIAVYLKMSVDILVDLLIGFALQSQNSMFCLQKNIVGVQYRRRLIKSVVGVLLRDNEAYVGPKYVLNMSLTVESIHMTTFRSPGK